MVVDSAGNPVAQAAVVLFSSKIVSMFGALTGDAGTSTRDDGSFEIPNAPDNAISILAAHRGGWYIASLIRTAKELTLQLQDGGSVSGVVRRERQGELVEIDLTLQASPALMLSYRSTSDGKFAIPPLPAGKWLVSVGLAQEMEGGASRKKEVTIDVKPKQNTLVNVELTAGITLVFVPVKQKVSMVEFSVFGDQVKVAPTTYQEMRALRKTLPSDQVENLLFGGSSAESPMQFHDRAAGKYIVCRNVAIAQQSPEFACKSITVNSTPDV
jgi:hypothetical protein